MPAALLFNGNYAPENGESDNMFVQRVCDTITKIAKNTNARTVGIATHAGVISVFVRRFTNFNFSSMPNAEYIKLQWDGKKFSFPEPPEWLLKTQSKQKQFIFHLFNLLPDFDYVGLRIAQTSATTVPKLAHRGKFLFIFQYLQKVQEFKTL